MKHSESLQLSLDPVAGPVGSGEGTDPRRTRENSGSAEIAVRTRRKVRQRGQTRKGTRKGTPKGVPAPSIPRAHIGAADAPATGWVSVDPAKKDTGVAIWDGPRLVGVFVLRCMTCGRRFCPLPLDGVGLGRG